MLVEGRRSNPLPVERFLNLGYPDSAVCGCWGVASVTRSCGSQNIELERKTIIETR